VAHLHIKNAGTLSLKYKMAVNVANELSGTNVFGEEFKLSDYLVFGKVDMADASAVFKNNDTGRQQARAAVGNTAGLSTYTEADNLYAESDANKPVGGKTEKYMALVIYMPETVGNEETICPAPPRRKSSSAFRLSQPSSIPKTTASEMSTMPSTGFSLLIPVGTMTPTLPLSLLLHTSWQVLQSLQITETTLAARQSYLVLTLI